MWVEGDVCKKANSSVTRAGSQYLPFQTQSGKWKLAVETLDRGGASRPEGAGGERRWT